MHLLITHQNLKSSRLTKQDSLALLSTTCTVLVQRRKQFWYSQYYTAFTNLRFQAASEDHWMQTVAAWDHEVADSTQKGRRNHQGGERRKLNHLKWTRADHMLTQSEVFYCRVCGHGPKNSIRCKQTKCLLQPGEEDQHIPFHGVAFVNMGRLLYPGVTRIRGAYSIHPFSDSELLNKVALLFFNLFTSITALEIQINLRSHMWHIDWDAWYK